MGFARARPILQSAASRGRRAGTMIKHVIAFGLMGVLGLGAGTAAAQTYPSHSVRAIVAFAPGGVTDTFTRLVAQKLSENLGKQFYVDNLAGASGNIGTAQAA